MKWKGRRPRRDDLDWRDVSADLPFDDEFGCVAGIAIALSVVALIVLSVLFVFPAVVFFLEVLILLVLIGGGAMARVVLRRPWTIEAREVATSRSVRQSHTWQVVGWKASESLMESVIAQIETGAAIDP